MNKSSAVILKAAEALEKIAQYFDEEENFLEEKRASDLEKNFLSPIMERVETGSDSLREKLANTDPEVLTLLKNLSGAEFGSSDNLLGEPTEKRASQQDSDPLLAFCMSDD